MDIAATYPVKQPVRQDALRDAPGPDDPYSDDFDAELSRATNAESEPARPEKSKPAKTEASVSAEDKQPKSKSEPDAPGEMPLLPATPTVAAPQFKIAGIQLPPNQPAATIAPDANVVAAKPVQTPVATTLQGNTAALVAPVTGPKPADASTTIATAPVQSNPPAADEPAIAATPTTTPTTTPTATPSISLPAGFALEMPQPAQPAQQSKKPSTQTGKTDLAQSSAPQGPAPQSSASTATAPVPQTGQNGAQKDETKGGDAKIAAAPAASAAAAQPQTQAQEFKIDASAAATAAPQPASAPAPNAPAMAPALVAQNAPIIVPPEALGVTIARKALEGVNKFELRLDPPELGRVDVTLEVDDTGTTRAHIRAERPEALELLQREAKGMEQALRQAGLQFDQSSLTFSLGGREGREAQEHGHHGRRAKFNAVLPEDEIHAGILRGGAPQADGLDLRV